LPHRQKSGLIDALHTLRDIKGIGFIEMQPEDVMRHRLVRDIVEAYTKADEERQTARLEAEAADGDRPLVVVNGKRTKV
jgi:phosphate starvation-inducible protein PhoH and related proteins